MTPTGYFQSQAFMASTFAPQLHQLCYLPMDMRTLNCGMQRLRATYGSLESHRPSADSRSLVCQCLLCASAVCLLFV
eukprot:m.31938 g.31938  ORF g.31938 m.31938 type:complete len:77 (-) comp12108_c0_seq11:906-1136(-)